MNIKVAHSPVFTPQESPLRVELPLSKSISNRLLAIATLGGVHVPRTHVADCDDTNAMLAAIATPDADNVNIGPAGTAMRFLTAIYAATPGINKTLDGSERMRLRPIGPLVDALRQCGASIIYAMQEGYPPLHIKGTKLAGGEIDINATVSSQYISALLMAAPYMTHGLSLTLLGTPVSTPYIEMTLKMMSRVGIDGKVVKTPRGLQINIPAGEYVIQENLTVEPDWSAASYWFEIAALTGTPILLPGLSTFAIQGDARAQEIFTLLGVSTTDTPGGLLIERTGHCCNATLERDLVHIPDVAQTLIATCCGLGQPFRFTGLSTLPVKETDRLAAMRDEMARLGFSLLIEGSDTISWDGSRLVPQDNPVIETYHDHRMAMAIAPLATLRPLTITNPSVVTKSYPHYWEHLALAGYEITLP